MVADLSERCCVGYIFGAAVLALLSLFYFFLQALVYGAKWVHQLAVSLVLLKMAAWHDTIHCLGAHGEHHKIWLRRCRHYLGREHVWSKGSSLKPYWQGSQYKTTAHH